MKDNLISDMEYKVFKQAMVDKTQAVKRNDRNEQIVKRTMKEMVAINAKR